MLDDYEFMDDDSLSDEEIIALVEMEGLEPLIDESLFDEFDEADDDSDWAE